MAKKKGTSVQIDDDVVKTARLVAALEDKPMAALISEILRPILAKMEAEGLAKKLAARQPDPGKSRPKGGH